MAKDRRTAQQLQSRLLDGATPVGVATFLYLHPTYVNPLGLTGVQWVFGFATIRLAIAFYDHLVVTLVELSGAPLLPTRTTGKPVRYVTLDRTSLLFLFINSFNEYVFVQRLCHYLYRSPAVPKPLSDLTPLNTLAALGVMFVVLDACYAPCHHLLHRPSLYPLIHKHHHRQHYPVRGYLDAGNEHPIEHLVGTMCTWAAVLSAVLTTGAHAVTIFLFFNVHAALAMLNHSPYDVAFAVLPGGGPLGRYSVGNHEMHHRTFTSNYAQYCMWYDYLMGTYAEYEGPSDKEVGGEKNARATTAKADASQKKAA